MELIIWGFLTAVSRHGWTPFLESRQRAHVPGLSFNTASLLLTAFLLLTSSVLRLEAHV